MTRTKTHPHPIATVTLVAAFCAGLGGCGDADNTRAMSGGLGDAGSAGAESGDGGQTDDADSGRDDETDGGGETGFICDQQGFSVQLSAPTPNVVLVLDKSRSMSNPWDHDGDPVSPDISRYNSLHNVVQSLTTQFEGTINFGAQLFPAADAFLDEPQNDNSCRVQPSPEVAVGPMTSSAILAAMPLADDLTISGGTPATAGIEAALAHLRGLPSDEPKAIVLVTDGAANCDPGQLPEDTLFVYDGRLPGVVEDAFATESIPTYVVGINILDEMGTKPATNPLDSLTDVAFSGGVPRQGADPFYNTFDELELVTALEDVVGRIECTVTLEVEPDHPDEVEITVDGIARDQLGSCGGGAGDGWAYSSPAGPFNTIELCGTACDALQSTGRVDVLYGCPE